MRDNGRVEDAGHNHIHVVRDDICCINVTTLTKRVCFLLSELAVFSLGLVLSNLEPLYNSRDVENLLEGELESEHEEQDIGVIDKSTSLEPFARVSVDDHQQQGGVDESCNGQLKSNGNIHLSLGLVELLV